MSSQPLKRLGRPTKPPAAGERIQIGVQVSPGVKRLLETAAEQNHRSISREAELRLERSFEQDRLLRGFGRLEAAFKGFTDKHRPLPTAEHKAIGLLKERLTPKQCEQLEKHQYFDVIGGNSGKTYRIHEGWGMNVAELKDGVPVAGLCFVPEGNLPAGDVMLGQKLALQSCEQAVLAIASRFDISPDWPKAPKVPEMPRISRRKASKK